MKCKFLFLLLLLPFVAFAQNPTTMTTIPMPKSIKAPITGTAAPGTRIVATYTNQQFETTADAEGNWTLSLPALKASKSANLVLTTYAPQAAAKRTKPTIFSIGDSTMANRSEENREAGWGQMLHEHLNNDILVDNHAKSGRSSKSFITEGRWQAVLDLLQPGDYVFIQFGHNDEKPDTTRHTDAHTSFKDNLRRFVTEAQDKGATPVIFNAMIRRKFEGNHLTNTHGDYIKTPFEVAEEMSVPYVDAESISKAFVESLGPEDSKSLFMWFPPEKQDDTHLNKYGARRMSKLFLDAAAKSLPALEKYILK